MEKTLAEKIKAQKTESLYKVTAAKFDTRYKYVWLIANEKRVCVRGKAKAIKEYLEEQTKNK